MTIDEMISGLGVAGLGKYAGPPGTSGSARRSARTSAWTGLTAEGEPRILWSAPGTSGRGMGRLVPVT